MSYYTEQVRTATGLRIPTACPSPTAQVLHPSTRPVNAMLQGTSTWSRGSGMPRSFGSPRLGDKP